MLWNLPLNPLLHEMDQRGIYCQGYVDDVVLDFSRDMALEVSEQIDATVSRVHEWGVRNKLRFALHKTYTMVITQKLKYETSFLTMGGTGIETITEIEVLNLTIDSMLTFNTHVGNICKKATNIYKQFSRAARLSRGLHTKIIRMIYTVAAEPVTIYAARV